MTEHLGFCFYNTVSFCLFPCGRLSCVFVSCWVHISVEYLIVSCLHAFVGRAGRLGGYRTMCQLLRQKHHMIVPHETVRVLLRQIDPVSVLNRRRHRLQRRTYCSRGPCHMWHIDGYDKLRPYGILISGYEIFLLWLILNYTCTWSYALVITFVT